MFELIHRIHTLALQQIHARQLGQKGRAVQGAKAAMRKPVQYGVTAVQTIVHATTLAPDTTKQGGPKCVKMHSVGAGRTAA